MSAAPMQRDNVEESTLWTPRFPWLYWWLYWFLLVQSPSDPKLSVALFATTANAWASQAPGPNPARTTAAPHSQQSCMDGPARAHCVGAISFLDYYILKESSEYGRSRRIASAFWCKATASVSIVQSSWVVLTLAKSCFAASSWKRFISPAISV